MCQCVGPYSAGFSPANPGRQQLPVPMAGTGVGHAPIAAVAAGNTHVVLLTDVAGAGKLRVWHFPVIPLARPRALPRRKKNQRKKNELIMNTYEHTYEHSHVNCEQA